MNKISARLNGNRFIPVDSEEKTALELIKKVVDKSNEVIEQVNTFESEHNTIKETVNSFDEKVTQYNNEVLSYKQEVDKLPTINANAEVLDARCGKATLGEFNRSISSQLEQIESEIPQITERLNKKPFIYNTVNDMISDTKLKIGDVCKTVGYRSLNGGGGANYRIKEKIESDVVDNASIIQLTNGLVAYLIPSDYITPQMFGCSCSGSDDYEYFKKACDYSSANNVKLLVTRSLAINGTITLKNFLTIEGVTTGIKLIQLGAVDMFKSTGTDNLFFVSISNLTLDGNNIATSLINFVDSVTPYGIDTCCLHDLILEKCNGNALSFGNNTLCGRAYNVIIQNCKGIGCRIVCHDGRFENFGIFNCSSAYGGLYVGGSENKISDFKVYLCGDGVNVCNGITISGSANSFSNLESQEHKGLGIVISGSDNRFSNLSISMISELNSTVQSIRLVSANRNIINCNLRKGGDNPNLIGINFNGICTGNIVMATGDPKTPQYNADLTQNFIVFNGQKLS